MAHLRIFGRSEGPSQSSRKRPRVIFVSHEATRTGAPKIILNILKQFHQICDVDCETIVHDDGHLLEEFGLYSRVNCLTLPRQRSSELQRKIRSIVKRKFSRVPSIAICNSMESRFVAEQLSEMGVPVISLVHELPCSYSESDYQEIYQYAEKIVFPVQAVRDLTNKKLAIPFGKDLIMPQGLLNADFGKAVERESARKRIRAELSLPQDAFVVLGCGTLDMRKGIDHFAAIARQVVQRNNFQDSIHFVWVGEGPRWPHSAFHYVQIDLRNSKVAAHVHFVGEREHVDDYFVGSDMFLLSSRVDPFPCVIHEAMATELPVMAFDQSGGASELLSNGCGFVIPYADYDLATNLILSLARNPGIADGIRQKSLTKVKEEYRFEDYAHRIIELSESIVGMNLPRLNMTPDNQRLRAA